jgi:ABC-type transport system substrate-binding protein
VATVLVAAMAAAGCGGDGGSDGRTAAGEATGRGVKSSRPAPDAVTILIPKTIDSFDPHTSFSEDGAQQFMMFVYDNLVRRTLDGEFAPGVAALIDSEQGGNAETQRLGNPIRSLYTDNIDCFDPKAAGALPAFDPDAAAEALDAAGYRKGPDGLRTKPDGSPLKLRVVGDHTQFKAPDYIAQALRDGGFDVDLKVGVRAESYARFFVGDYDLGSYPFISATPLPALYFNQVSGSGALDNLSKIDNPSYVEHAKEAWAAPPDSPERCKGWQTAERDLLENADAVPLDQPVKYWFGHGLTFNAVYYKVDPFSIRSV